MLEAYAPHFIEIGRLIESRQYGIAAHADPAAFPNQQQYDETMRMFNDLLGYCRNLRLTVASRSLERTVAQFSQGVPNHGEVQRHIDQWYSCFRSELEGSLFLLVLPHRVPFYSGGADGPEIHKLVISLSYFPSALYDAREAGNCFAFECFTASVYHLMRCAEYGLVTVSTCINVPAEKRTSWGKMIQGIEAAIKVISSTKPTTDWQDEVKKYSDLCSWFTVIKNGWRNPVSHVPRVYSERTATAMFAATTTLFEHLERKGFREVPMPSEAIAPPEE